MSTTVDSTRQEGKGHSPEPAEEETTGGNDREGTETLSKDQAFDVLRNGRRRAVISCLRDRGGELSVKELSTCVAAEEYDVSAADLSPEQYKRVYTGLYQCHLDRMEELGVIEFDRDENAVRLDDVASNLEPYLDDPTGSGAVGIEIGVAMAVISIVTLGVAGVGPFGAVSATALAALTSVALLGVALFRVVG